jgi:Holliday junction resolvase RusA-like endonuclease
MIEFILHCEPPKHTAQGSSMILKSKKTGKYLIGKKANSKATQTKQELLALLYQHAPQTPLQGALKLEIRWVYSWRKSETKKNRAKGEMWCITKPDTDNLCKLFNDCLTRLAFWKDDAQVSVLHFEKLYADNPRIEVKITEIG